MYDEFGDKKFIISVLAFVVGAILLSCLLGILLSSNNNKFEVNDTTVDKAQSEMVETIVNPQIVKIEHIKETSAIVPVKMGKITVYQKIHHPAKFLVTVTYDDITETFDNEKLFNAVENGEEIQLILLQKFDKETGELVHEYLKLAD